MNQGRPQIDDDDDASNNMLEQPDIMELQRQ
jgi:hypothetical protein